MQRLFLIITACLALLVAGCGGDSSSTTSSATNPDSSSDSKFSAENLREEAAVAAEEREEKEKVDAKKAKAEEAKEEKAAEEAAAELPEVTVPKGPPPKNLVVEDLEQGTGATAKAGDQASVSYVGVLYKDGEIFDSSWGKDSEPFTFTLGAQEVIKGWDQGVQGMKVGGKRKLIVPPNLAYGPEGIYPSIPPNSTLVFLVELQGVK